jgi:hypothetical protein
MTVVLNPPYFCLFPQSKTELKGRHFGMTAVMEAELQAVLKNLTEHDFQDTFKNGRSAGIGAWKGTTLRMVVASKLKVSF